MYRLEPHDTVDEPELRALVEATRREAERYGLRLDAVEVSEREPTDKWRDTTDGE